MLVCFFTEDSFFVFFLIQKHYSILHIITPKIVRVYKIWHTAALEEGDNHSTHTKLNSSK